MPRLEGKSFNSPDATRTPEKAKIDSVTVGGLTFARETLQPAWRWSSHVKPTVGGESCQRRHVGDEPNVLYELAEATREE